MKNNTSLRLRIDPISKSYYDNLQEDFSTFVSMECWDFLSSLRPLIGRAESDRAKDISSDL